MALDFSSKTKAIATLTLILWVLRCWNGCACIDGPLDELLSELRFGGVIDLYDWLLALNSQTYGDAKDLLWRRSESVAGENNYEICGKELFRGTDCMSVVADPEVDADRDNISRLIGLYIGFVIFELQMRWVALSLKSLTEDKTYAQSSTIGNGACPWAESGVLLINILNLVKRLL